jgi:hypothetical protein
MSTFIEILVSLAILSIALLTLLSAENKALAQMTSSEQMNQATLLLMDGVGRKRLDSNWQTLVSKQLPQGQGMITPQTISVQWMDKYDQSNPTLSVPRPVAR